MKNTFTLVAAICGSLSLAALSLVFSAPAEAVIVNVNGTDYDVTVFNDRFPTDDRITEMPWWGNESLAEQFAIALG